MQAIPRPEPYPEEGSPLPVRRRAVRTMTKGCHRKGSHDNHDLHPHQRSGPGSPATGPGHWLLARLGKRVLRPGGRQLTNRMIEALNIGPSDAVVEFAPGLGETARLTL